MGTREERTPSRPSKPASSTQEVPTTPYPDWSSSMQAYYGAAATPTPFFPSPIASPSAHPYMWGSQHPFMAPYGTPIPYPAMFPPGGVYTHPSMATVPSSAPINAEKEGEDQESVKKARGMSREKGGEGGKVASGSGNDGVSQSNANGSEDSSVRSDEDASHQEHASNRKGSFQQMLVDASQQSRTTGALQAPLPGKPLAPATNLNIGMDLWNVSMAAGAAANVRPNMSGATAPAPMVGQEGLMPDRWIQDERELKRQKRKQSNRESARRSRLRKQAECVELQHKVENLTNENNSLREELQRLSEECKKLTAENNSMKDKLTGSCRPKATDNLEQTTE